ncbi:hypothetical protein CY35_13G041700 [Sphagnum magellanicum]|nr:hypothetical protein CY35_13G041700 [Sphagnum magellanicum]KAH9543049.1 hypothetical protein CY35_13G041700 [Sphagnum magellanicum]
MIIDYKLTYPSGMATAILINGFHSPEGAEVAKKQVKVLGKNFTLSFAFSFFKWFFSGIGDNCGFDNFPTLGLTAFNNCLYFNFSLTYVGAGMICPHIVNISLLLGAILSWGLMWPLIRNPQGDWYPAGLAETNFKGLYGYKVFIAIALILGDGLYNIVKITIISAHSMFIHHKNHQQLPVVAEGELDMLEKDKKRRDLVFLKAGIPLWAAGAVCGVMMSIVSTASDLMQDFKTGYLTLSSPRSMFVSQLVGTLMGCFLAPVTFWMFYKAFDLGDPNGEYPAPYAVVYRSMAVVGVEGFKVLPTHCLQLCYGFFAAGVAINAVRDLLPKKVSQYIPIPMAMAIPFYIGGYFTIDMFLGTVIKFYWERMNRKKSDIFTPAIAAGLICGDGVWTIPSAILALAKVNPPLCMQFLPAKVANAG